MLKSSEEPSDLSIESSDLIFAVILIAPVADDKEPNMNAAHQVQLAVHMTIFWKILTRRTCRMTVTKVAVRIGIRKLLKTSHLLLNETSKISGARNMYNNAVDGCNVPTDELRSTADLNRWHSG